MARSPTWGRSTPSSGTRPRVFAVPSASRFPRRECPRWARGGEQILFSFGFHSNRGRLQRAVVTAASLTRTLSLALSTRARVRVLPRGTTAPTHIFVFTYNCCLIRLTSLQSLCIAFPRHPRQGSTGLGVAASMYSSLCSKSWVPVQAWVSASGSHVAISPRSSCAVGPIKVASPIKDKKTATLPRRGRTARHTTHAGLYAVPSESSVRIDVAGNAPSHGSSAVFSVAATGHPAIAIRIRPRHRIVTGDHTAARGTRTRTRLQDLQPRTCVRSPALASWGG